MNKLTNLVVVLFVCFQYNIIHSQSKIERHIQEVGDVLQVAMPISVGLITITSDDKEGSWQFAKSFATNLAITYAMKYTIDKDRPGNVSHGMSFPSGHTSVAFNSASFIHLRYGWDKSIPAYALAGFVAYSRLHGEGNKHDGWDILGGIVVGIGSSYIFTTSHKKEDIKITFSSQNKEFLLGLQYNF